jgi:hypothetical protein
MFIREINKVLRSKLSEEKGGELIKLTPELVKLIIKTIKYSKGGLDKEEREELGQDLLLLAYEVLDSIID